MKKLTIFTLFFLIINSYTYASVSIDINTANLNFGNITPAGNWPTNQPADNVSLTNPAWNGIWNNYANLNLSVTSTELSEVTIYLCNVDQPGYSYLFNQKQVNGIWQEGGIGLLNNTAMQLTNNLSSSVLSVRYQIVSASSGTAINEFRWLKDKDNSNDNPNKTTAPYFNYASSYLTFWEAIPAGTASATLQFRIATPFNKYLGAYTGVIKIIIYPQAQ